MVTGAFLVFLLIVGFVSGSCPSEGPAPPAGGSYVCSDISDGATCSLSCTLPYTVQGGAATCENDTWEYAPEPAQCVIGDWTAWSPCSALCGNGTQTRNCTSPGSALCNGLLVQSQLCQMAPCVNCSYYWGGWSPCTRSCGIGGYTVRKSYIMSAASPGAPIQCPPQYENSSCNTNLCQGYLPGRGFYWWELCPSVDTLFTYVVGSQTGQPIDMFLFEAGFNYDSYLKDVMRFNTPRNWGYNYLSAFLNTNNGNGAVNLTGGQCYYFVVDNTQVGSATGPFQELWFSQQLTGNPENVIGYWGPGTPGSASTAAFSALLLSFLAVFSYLASN